MGVAMVDAKEGPSDKVSMMMSESHRWAGPRYMASATVASLDRAIAPMHAGAVRKDRMYDAGTIPYPLSSI